uniref:Vacuolar protein sorting-associated protein 13B n=1 Tax=Sphaerodactylus townsendi TaxID=933632 RepID=A0ACB8FEY8_9SAUR
MLRLQTQLQTGVKSKNPLPTLEGSIQNVELKYCSTSLVKCASGTMGSIKFCAKAPGGGGKEKLIPLIQGPSDTRDLHSSKWLNESRKPESLLAPDLLAFTIQVPQHKDYNYNSASRSLLKPASENRELFSLLFHKLLFMEKLVQVGQVGCFCPFFLLRLKQSEEESFELNKL